jgi:peptidoglycan/xylan/chitin deacetylase (PgdA/CDA1 family)
MKRAAFVFLFLGSVLALASSTVTIGISPTSVTLVSKGTQQFTATVGGTTNTSVKWSSSAGTITSTGLFTAPSVTATKLVTVRVTSLANTNVYAKASVTVNPPPPFLKRIVLSPTSAAIYVGATQQFSAVAYDQYGHTMAVPVAFESSNYSVAVIDTASGLTTGEKAGTAYIHAYSGSVLSNRATLTVSVVPPPSASLTLTRLSPAFGLTGISGDFKHLTIYGTGFASGATVNFGSDVLTPVSVTDTSVVVTVPYTEFTTTRTVQVTVTNPGTAPSAALSFSIINQGFASLTFDDGYYSAYSKGIPILDAAGIKCTFYTITTLVNDTYDGYVTQAQLQTLYKNGHEIGNHTRTHPDLTLVTPTQLTSETSGAEGDFAALFNLPAPQTFAYPYDQYNDTVVAAVQASGVRGARDSDYGGANNATSNPFLLDSQPSEYDLGTDNVATVTGWIQQAVANRMWVIILWHRVDETGNPISVPSTVIQGVVDYINANGVYVATDSEGLVIENMNPPQQ